MRSWRDRFLDAENFEAAWAKIRAKGSKCPGVDGVTLDRLDANFEQVLKQVRLELKNGIYRPMPLKPLVLPKKSGEWRNIGVPTFRDRLVQQALLNVFHEIMEPQFEDCSYAYRPGRSYKMAVQELHHWYREGYRWVLDADLVKFFDQLLHDRLLEEVKERTREPLFLNLVEGWLSAGTLTAEGLIRPEKGVPQGSIISPILANIYLDDFDEMFSSRQYKLVRFADDFVLLAKSQKAILRVKKRVEQYLADMGLQLHPDKTKVTSFQKGFKFLGHTFVGDLVIENRRSHGDQVVPMEPKPKIRKAERVIYTDPVEEPSALSQALLAATQEYQATIPAPLYVVFGYEPRKQERLDFISKEIVWLTSMASLYLVDQGSTVRQDHQRFVVERKGQEQIELPIADVERILVFGNVHLTTSAMSQCLEHNIPVFYLSRYGSYKGHLWNGADKNFYAVRCQFALSVDSVFRQQVAVAIVQAKLWNSRQLLKRLVKPEDPEVVRQAIAKLETYREDLSAEMSIDQIMGFEGVGAACYFKAMGQLIRHPDFEFKNRNYFPPRDPVNALLSFGYSLLLSNVMSLLLAEGMNLCLGNLHGGEKPKPYLAFDLMEEFRSPIVDTLVIQLLNQRVIRPTDFTWPQENGGVYLDDSARKVFLRHFEERMVTKTAHPDVMERVSYRRAIHLQMKRYVRSLLGEKPYEGFRRLK